VITGDLVFVSGQVPMLDGRVGWTGKVGAGVSPEEAAKACRQCFINVLVQLKVATGDLDRVVQVVRLGGFIAAPPEFTQHAVAMNGASNLAVDVFGDRGRHARTTIGVASLPLDAAAEVEGLFRIA
jgi:enamine deaminase RidA (YjgF/YER057c/UK114 family)